MKYGINLLFTTDDVTEQHFPLLGELKGVGYDGVEIPLLVKHDQPHYRRIRQELDGVGLTCTTVAIATAEANPISPDPRVRQAALDHLKWAIATSAVLGSETLCGPLHSALGVFPQVSPAGSELAVLSARAAEVLAEAAEVAERHGITLALEYLNRFECFLVNTAHDLHGLVSLVNHPSCRMMWDTFHAHIEEEKAYGALACYAGRIAHVHVSENTRGIPGTGQVDWHWTFKALKDGGYDGWLTIEAFGQKLPALAAATKIWRPLFASDEELYVKGLRFLQEKWR